MPDFAYTVRLTCLLDAIGTAASTGTNSYRSLPDVWPRLSKIAEPLDKSVTLIGGCEMVERLFSIRGYEDDFYVGLMDDGRQAVLGLLCPSLVAYFFSANGHLIGREVRPWEYPAPRTKGFGYAIYDKQFQILLAEQIQRWKDEEGFSPGPIHVKAFFDAEYYVGFEQQADNDEVGTDSEIIFYWAKEYFLSPDGEVEST